MFGKQFSSRLIEKSYPRFLYKSTSCIIREKESVMGVYQLQNGNVKPTNIALGVSHNNAKKRDLKGTNQRSKTSFFEVRFLPG